jgi:hypothetical protein
MKNIYTRVIFIILIFSLLNFSTSVLLNNENEIILKTNSSGLKIYNKLNRDIVWNVSLNFTEPGGASDYVIFGEAPDANDGPPADDYDAPKPPAPPTPYIRAWFDDNLESPYTKMFNDYRIYPDTEKVWNLTVFWVTDDETPTTVNVSWNNSELIDSEYNSIVLYDVENNIEIDMVINSFYEFTCPSEIKQDFKIYCTITQNQIPIVVNYYPPNGSTGLERPPSELNVTVEDPEGDTMYVYIRWKNHNNVWVTLENYSEVGNGTYNYVPSGNDWIWGNTMYNWSVNITDGTSWTNESYNYTTEGSRYDVNNDNKVNFQDAGLVWVHRTSEVPYDGIYDVNQDGQVNFQDAGLTWVNRD